MSLRRAKNGTGGEIKFCNKYVYHEWDSGRYTMETLGRKMNKTVWIHDSVEDVPNWKHVCSVEIMLTDWTMYENGWVVKGDQNQHLFYYKCQIRNYGDKRPQALEYLKNIK
tara:strand:- start:325 stop:657 length:333 start_codon:yes stop_codon:yes gene_type:complete